MNDWNPFEEPVVSPRDSSVSIFGVEVNRGTRVRLLPQRRADIFDLALAGKLATVESIEKTFEDEVYLAVTIDDDPGADLGAERQIGHRFFFRADEVEPLPFPADTMEDK